MSGKKDILMLLDAFDPDYFGGAARVFREISKELTSDGHRVRAICRILRDKKLPEEVAEFISYNDISGGTAKKTAYYRRSIRRLLFASIAERAPDIIVLHSSSAALGALDILSKTSIPVIYYFHSPWSSEHELKRGIESMSFWNPMKPLALLESWFRKRHERSYLLTASGIVTLSEYMAGKMLEVHGEKTMETIKRSVIPGGVDREIFHPVASINERNDIRTRLSLPTDAFVIISSRRMIPRTGLDMLIQAFANFADDIKDKSLLVLTGDGPLMTNLKEFTAELGVERSVIFTGHVPEPVLAEHYRCADLFVMPTRELEGFGLSTVEAMASGLPVIGTNIGGTPEILSRISRDLIIKEPTMEAIFEKIAEFAAMDDLDGWRECSMKAVEERHTWKAHVDSFLNFADSLST